MNNNIEVKHIALIPLLGTERMAEVIQRDLSNISDNIICEIINVDLPRFTTGDSKAVLQESVRGKDVYILCDVSNNSCKYLIFNCENRLSPDEHYLNLVRTISAIGGKASRINVVMPMLYSSRQDRRASRESLDCAVALQQLNSIGVENIMAIDVHDDRVQNAVPFVGFDNLMPTYQTIKVLCKNFSDVIFDEQHTVMVSPDFGAMNRNFAFANELGLDIGVFYKRRDLKKVVDGRNAILLHKYIGPSLKGKDVIMIDDIISSGETMLDSVELIKEMGARRIFIGTSFGLFTKGVKRFDEAYKKGLFDAVFITNASYVKEEITQAAWYKEVDILKYISYYIYSVNTGISVSKIMDPHLKIVEYIKKYKERQASCLS